MKTKILLPILIVLSLMVWWLSGYDFDRRGVDIGILFFANILAIIGILLGKLSYEN